MLRYPLIKIRRGTTHLIEGVREDERREGEDGGREVEGENGGSEVKGRG